MGNEGSEMTFLRPPYYRDSDQNVRVFEASLVWGITEGRTTGKQSERDRVREVIRENQLGKEGKTNLCRRSRLSIAENIN